ncbi:MAG: hypothetical protein WCW13_03245 [archaeon]
MNSNPKRTINAPNTNPEDVWLIKLFQNFEIMLPAKKDIDWSISSEFHVYSKYLIKDIEDIQKRLEHPDDDYLYYVCGHIFNILDWIKLMVEDAGCITFSSAWEKLFDEKFEDKHILQHIYTDCFEKWISKKNGQYKIGMNFYNILGGKLYYRDRFDKWFEVEKTTAFDLKPNKKHINDLDIIKQLNKQYKETPYDALLKQWKNKNYRGVLPNTFFQFNHDITTPEKYFDFALANIKKLLKNPVSLTEIQRWNNDEVIDVEHIMKIAVFVSDLVAKRRKEDSHTLYLLRDSLIFHETHMAMDILNGKNTSSDQILVGRKLLSNKKGVWGYYVVTLTCLYEAQLRYPDDFTQFYNEYARLLDNFVSVNSKFAKIIANLKDYIKQHIRTDKRKIVIFDIGFQGSIALLTKYVIDRYLSQNGKIKTDIEIGVGAEWLKELFGYRHDSNYFPLLTHIQLMSRSDKLYHYIEGSLASGKLKVKMGDKKTQHDATVELIVVMMILRVLQDKKK